MADVGVQYVLGTPAWAPDITFNAGTDPYDGTDKYYITEIRGLGSPALRTPVDNVPLGDGGIIHPFWMGPRHIAVEGIFLINSTEIENSIVVIRNDMEADLTDALESLLRDNGTFSFAPQGQGTRTFTVRYEVGLEFTHIDNYLTVAFSFGLIAAEPDWSGSS